EKIPVKKIIDLIQYLENEILPKLQAANGKNYERHKMLLDALVWAINVEGCFDRLRAELSNERLLNGFYKQRIEFLEQRLQYYTSMEELNLQESYNFFKKSIQNSYGQSEGANNTDR